MSTTAVHKGRWAAVPDREEFVVFLIGMRINQPLAVHRWWPVLIAMPRMLRHLSADPRSGLLGFHVWPGRTVLVLQYWESTDALVAFSRDPAQQHLPAWRRFNTAVGASGAVGIWHETYTVAAAGVEAVYGNMPRFGLARAMGHAPATGTQRSARTRLGQSDPTPPTVPDY